MATYPYDDFDHLRGADVDHGLLMMTVCVAYLSLLPAMGNANPKDHAL